MGQVAFLWICSGFVAHISWCIKKGKWCGVPIWEEPTTYMMFLIAAILGPFTFLLPE